MPTGCACFRLVQGIGRISVAQGSANSPAGPRPPQVPAHPTHHRRRLHGHVDGGQPRSRDARQPITSRRDAPPDRK